MNLSKSKRTQAHNWLQEMADAAQDDGMHPSNINAVCDCFNEMVRLVRYVGTHNCGTNLEERAKRILRLLDPKKSASGTL